MRAVKYYSAAFFTLTTALAGCSREDAAANILASKQDVSLSASTTINMNEALLNTPDEEAVVADAWVEEPDEAFLDACVLASFPTGGLVRVGEARTGDFLATVDSEGTGAFEAGDEGSFIYRVNKEDRLTLVTTSVAIGLRQTNTPPIEDATCGPRAVVVNAVARDDQRANAMQTYAAVREMAQRAKRSRESGALGTLPFHEPASTAGDGPYTETIISEQAALNRAVAREMNLVR